MNEMNLFSTREYAHGTREYLYTRLKSETFKKKLRSFAHSILHQRLLWLCGLYQREGVVMLLHLQ